MQYREIFRILFEKYRRLGYDNYTARYLTYRDLRKVYVGC